MPNNMYSLYILLLSSTLANAPALRVGDVFLFVCLSAVKFVKSFATWQHLVASVGLSYRLRYIHLFHLC